MRHAWEDQVRSNNVIWIINNVKSYVRKHVNFRYSMTTAGLFGMWDLDTDVPFYNISNTDEIAGFLSMRQVLYNHMKMSDGHLWKSINRAAW